MSNQNGGCNQNGGWLLLQPEYLYFMAGGQDDCYHDKINLAEKGLLTGSKEPIFTGITQLKGVPSEEGSHNWFKKSRDLVINLDKKTPELTTDEPFPEDAWLLLTKDRLYLMSNKSHNEIRLTQANGFLTEYKKPALTELFELNGVPDCWFKNEEGKAQARNLVVNFDPLELRACAK